MTWAVWDRWSAAYPLLSVSDIRCANIALNDAGTNYWNTAAFDYFGDSAVAGDYLYFAATRQFWGIKLEVGTAFAASSVEFIWEYKTGSSTWATLPVSNPNALLSTGTQIVLFTPPDEDWYADREKGLPVRCRIVSVTGITEGGANATNKVEWLFKALQFTGTATDLSAAMTAELAGSYTVLAATAPAASMTPLRMPVLSLRAMSKLDVVLAGGSAGAGDTVTLTGVDYGGSAFSEEIDVSAGNGTYATTRYYADCTEVACVGWSDGTITVNQKRLGLINEIYPGEYIFGACLVIGDDATVTTLTLKDLSLTFVHAAFWYAMGRATMTFGELLNSGLPSEAGARGCYIREQNPQLGVAYRWNRFGGGYQGTSFTYSCTLNLYGTYWYTENYGYNSYRSYFEVASPSALAIKDCTFVSNDYNQPLVAFGTVTATIERTQISCASYFSLSSTLPVTVDQVRLSTGALVQGNQALTLTGMDAVSVLCWMFASNGRLNFVNGTLDEGDFSIGFSGMTKEVDCIWLLYTFDLTVIDAAGDPVDGASVEIVDADTTTVFSGTTDSNGQITQQQLKRKVADHASGAGVFTWSTKTPHTLTVSADGYNDYVMIMEMDQARDEIVVMSTGGSVIVIED